MEKFRLVQATKAKNQQVRQQQTREFLHSEGYHKKKRQPMEW